MARQIILRFPFILIILPHARPQFSESPAQQRFKGASWWLMVPLLQSLIHRLIYFSSLFVSMLDNSKCNKRKPIHYRCIYQTAFKVFQKEPAKNDSTPSFSKKKKEINFSGSAVEPVEFRRQTLNLDNYVLFKCDTAAGWGKPSLASLGASGLWIEQAAFPATVSWKKERKIIKNSRHIQ